MNPELLFYVLVVMALGILSYAVGRIILTICRIKQNYLYASAAPMLGMFALAMQLWFYGFVHIPWNIATLFLPWVVVAFVIRKSLAATLTLEKRLPSKIKQVLSQTDWLGRTLLVLTGLFMFACLVSLIVEPFVTSDILAMWGYKAKEFFVHGQVLVNSYINSSPGSARFYHVDYPPLWPLMSDIGYTFIGHVSETLFKAIQFIFVVSGVTSLFVFVRSRIANQANTIAAIAVFIFMAAPQFIPMLMFFKYMGYADYVICVTMLFTGIFVVRSLNNPGGPDWWLALTFAVAASVIKNEGIPFLVIILVVLGALYAAKLWQNRKNIKWKPIIITAVGALLLLVPVAMWTAYKAMHGIESEFSLGSIAASGMTIPARLYVIFKHIWLYVSTNPPFIWQGMAIALALVCTILRRTKATIVIGIIVIGQLGAYVVSYMLSPNDLAFHIPSSIDRITTHVLPLVILWLALLIADSQLKQAAAIKKTRAKA